MLQVEEEKNKAALEATIAAKVSALEADKVCACGPVILPHHTRYVRCAPQVEGCIPISLAQHSLKKLKYWLGIFLAITKP